MLTSLFSLFYVTGEFHRLLHRGRASPGKFHNYFWWSSSIVRRYRVRNRNILFVTETSIALSTDWTMDSAYTVTVTRRLDSRYFQTVPSKVHPSSSISKQAFVIRSSVLLRSFLILFTLKLVLLKSVLCWWSFSFDCLICFNRSSCLTEKSWTEVLNSLNSVDIVSNLKWSGSSSSLEGP